MFVASQMGDLIWFHLFYRMINKSSWSDQGSSFYAPVACDEILKAIYGCKDTAFNP